MYDATNLCNYVMYIIIYELYNLQLNNIIMLMLGLGNILILSCIAILTL